VASPIATTNGATATARRRRRQQAEERLAAGSAWEGEDLITTTRLGGAVMPRSLDRALQLIVEKAGLPRLTSHGLRHTAATHMVRGARDVGELRAVADVLGHSPDMLMKVCAHALPEAARRRRPHCRELRPRRATVVASVPDQSRSRCG
jgi:integrase